MRLIWLQVHGYKRFAEEAKTYVDDKVIAVVGPNEAGKTSLLQAYTSLSSEDPFHDGELSRSARPERGQAIVQAGFLLEDEDLDVIAEELDVVVDDLRWFIVSKLDTGEFVGRLIDPLSREVSQRSSTIKAVRRVLKRSPRFRPEDEEDSAADLAESLTDLVERIEAAGESTSPETLATLESVVDEYETFLEPDDRGYVKKVPELLRLLAKTERLDHPNDQAVALLRRRLPEFLFFDEEERDLRSTYDLEIEASSPPAAIANLAGIAGLPLLELRVAMRADDSGGVATLIERANARLNSELSDAWSQSGITVRFDTNGTILHVLAGETDTRFFRIADRSDGLRAFVALAAFVGMERSQPPILLVDEAESHLHYDAQADLVQMLTRQTLAAKVIYTTHSAGCLPEDLSAVRTVIPDDRRGTSRISDRFWEGGPGLAPLLLGLGASAFAFSAVRFAVIAEGAADFILLPTLLRQVAGSEYLGFQVVPGLAEVSDVGIKELDLTAARVAYLHDTNGGGTRHRSRLLENGVSRDRIIELIELADATAEDLVEGGVFVEAVNEELRRSHGSMTKLTVDDLEVSRPGRQARLEAWCAQEGVPIPPKRAVADHVVEQARRGADIVSPRRTADLIATLDRIHLSLGLRGD